MIGPHRADLAARFPNTSVQRFPKANHLVMAEADVAGARSAGFVPIHYEGPELWATIDALL